MDNLHYQYFNVSSVCLCVRVCVTDVTSLINLDWARIREKIVTSSYVYIAN